MPQLTRTGLRAALALTLITLGPAAPVLAQQPGEDPALVQRIDPHQPVRDGKTVLTEGHIDVGPLFVKGRWTLMIHDDTRKAEGLQSVWRHTEQTVLQVRDAGRLRMPKDPTYAFLHAKPGAPVYVVPETQAHGVVRVGWNTQDPKVMQTIDRGATMTLTSVQGPGSLVVYLQSGSFSKPKVLWDSTGKPNPVWLDVNTHTHANWVFTKPGVYLVQIRIAADLLDGRKVTDTRELRFAVGTATSPDQAFAAAWHGPAPASASGPTATSTTAPADDDGGGLSAGVLIAIVLAALALIGGLAFVALRGARAKRIAEQSRAPRTASGDDDLEGGRA